MAVAPMMALSQDARALLERLRSEPRRLIVPWLLPSRNELDDLLKRNPLEYMRWKSSTGGAVAALARRYALPPIGKGEKVLVATLWREEARRRDPDNIVSGGRKVLLDALGPGRKGERGWRGAGLLHCDGWHCVAGFVDVFAVGEPGIEVVVAPVQLELPLSREAREVRIDMRGAG